MASYEYLCGNTAIQESVTGKKYNSPCGFWGCSNQDFREWLETLRMRVEIGKRAYKKLEELTTLQGQGSLTDTEKLLKSNLQDLEGIYNEMRTTGNDLESSEYKAKINELLPHISDSACIIEYIQQAIAERGGNPQTSGLIKTTTDESRATTAMKWIGIGFVAYLAFRWVDKM